LVGNNNNCSSIVGCAYVDRLDNIRVVVAELGINTIR